MFLRVVGRITINAASLNTQGGAGTNYIEMTKVPVVVRTDLGNHRVVNEVPAISGNMIRHCHFVGFLEEFRQTDFGRNLTLDAWRGDIALRFGQQVEEVNSAVKDGSGNYRSVDLTQSEEATIKALADADLYGFLVTAKRNFRRTSLLGFSFLLPTEEMVEEVEVKSVIHNRVVVDQRGMVDPTAMMPFKREYSSAVYGFSAFLDLKYIGRPLADRAKTPVVDQDERKARARAAVLGFVHLLSGRAGAGLARGLPVSRVDSLLVAASDQPIPLVVNGYYRDYLQESQSLLSSYANLANATITLHVYPKGIVPEESEKLEKEPEQEPKQPQGKLQVKGYDHWVDLLKAVADGVTTAQEFSDQS